MVYEEELTLKTYFLELDASALFKPVPRIGLLGGLVLSIPLGGDNKLTFTDLEIREEGKKSGDMDELADMADANLNTFANIKVGGQFLVNDNAAVTVSYLMPIGTYFKGDIDFSRLVAGINFRI